LVGKYKNPAEFIGVKKMENILKSILKIGGHIDMKEIKLTRGKIALVDDLDFEWLNQFKWFVLTGTHTFYAGRWTGKQTIRMHREILNISDNLEVDHIDHNGLNNQRFNLRAASRSQNKCNSRKFHGMLPYRGVEYIPKTGKYRARITLNNKAFNLGHFHSAVNAAAKYDQKAEELFGEFATLNFPKSGNLF
jgi:hypothetical protein